MSPHTAHWVWREQVQHSLQCLLESAAIAEEKAHHHLKTLAQTLLDHRLKTIKRSARIDRIITGGAYRIAEKVSPTSEITHRLAVNAEDTHSETNREEAQAEARAQALTQAIPTMSVPSLHGLIAQLMTKKQIPPLPVKLDVREIPLF